MTNILSASFSDNEGVSAVWAVQSGAATTSNSTDYAVTGTKSFKGVATSTASQKFGMAYGDRQAATAGTTYTITVPMRSSVSRFCNYSIDWYNSGGSYLSTDTSSGIMTSTTGFTSVVDTSLAPANTASFTLGINFDNNANGTLFYMDAIIVDDGSSPAARNRAMVIS